MEAVKHSSTFNINPRLIYEALGSKIIEFDSIAISEQIKNAADAKAKNIVVDFSNFYNDLIIISDDGTGMDIDDIKNNWFFIGTDNKANHSTQLGGKGIGRFSLFRLANIIEIETINNGIKYNFTLNKSELEEESVASEINVEILETELSQDHKESGTVISLRKINKNIDFKEIQKDLENLNTPFTDKVFTVKYPENTKLVNYLPPQEVVKNASFFATAEFIGNDILDYEFICEAHDKVIYKNTDVTKIENELLEYNFDVDIGITKVYIYNFFLENKYRKPLGINYNKIRDNFLSAYQGISVYRNNFKIYGHGEVDWLKLAEKRVARPGENIDNKLTFGYVILDNFSSSSLEEKTSREGFIRNSTSAYFNKVIELIVKQIGQDRQISTEKLRNYLDSLNSEPQKEKKNTDTPSGQSNDSEGIEDQSSDRKGRVDQLNDPEGREDQSTNNNESENSNTSANSSNTIGNNESNFRYQSNRRIGSFDQQIFNKIHSSKIRDLLNEILTIDISRYPLATSFLFRSLIEISMNEYILKNFDTIKPHFKDYFVDENNIIKLKFMRNNDTIFKDIPIRKKILEYKTYLTKTKKYDPRSLRHLDDLVTFIDDINLAIHWTDKKVSINELQTQWNNSLFFLEYLFSNI